MLKQKILLLEDKLSQLSLQLDEENKNEDSSLFYSKPHPCFEFFEDFE